MPKYAKLPSISVFSPCLNEAENIPRMVEMVCGYIPTIAKNYEYIIVDDGSSDKTIKLVQRLQKKYSHLHLVSHDHNLGYGAALQTGIKHCSSAWIMWLDGDLQFDIKNLDAFLPYAKDFDAIIGFRNHRADTFLRRVNGELYTQLINTLFSMKVRDIDCAFKLIRAPLIKKLELNATGAFTSAEILIKLHEKKSKIKQVAVPHFPRRKGTPTGGKLSVITRGLVEVLTYFCYSRLLV